MLEKIISLVLVLIVTTSPVTVFAQAAGGAGLTPQEKAELTGTRKQMATIIFSGLAGSILGLSTLSFYGRPQKHMQNIAIGFAVGVIGGAIFTTYKAATKPYEAYDISQINSGLDDVSAQLVAADTTRSEQKEQAKIEPTISWRWSY